jgi:hypothetical protein
LNAPLIQTRGIAKGPANIIAANTAMDVRNHGIFFGSLAMRGMFFLFAALL